MFRLKARFFAPIIALLLISASQVRAGNINWTYNWNPGALALYGDSGTKGGYLAFTDEPSAGATNSSDIVATNVRTVSGASPNLPDQFVGTGVYTLALQITDSASGQSGILTFSGKLGGTFSDSNANVSNHFTGLLTQQLFLGNNTYTVTIGPYTPPGPPSATNAGSISAHVDVSGISIQSVPEPSTMALSIFGLTTVGAGWWRKRRAVKV
jgi:hypothetical protein